MIIRLVKMHFREESCEDFHRLFLSVQPAIAAFPGCMHVELLRDINEPSVFFTLSHWQSPADLEQYRHSELFENTWAKTKALFKDKAMAWSVEQM